MAEINTYLLTNRVPLNFEVTMANWLVLVLAANRTVFPESNGIKISNVNKIADTV